MKIQIRCSSYIDRRTTDLIARGDSIEVKRYLWRVGRNPKERARLERQQRWPPYPVPA
jgi:hypothetical protein